MPQPDHVIALPLEDPLATQEADIKKYFDKCLEKIGFVPNVLQGYTFKPDRWRAFVTMYHAVMDKKTSKLSPLEREMIAVVVSSVNRCYYCLVAHGAAVRQLSGDPELGEMLVMNYRVAPLDGRQRAMLDFAWKLTETPYLVEEADRAALRAAGFDDEDIWDIGETVAFYNFSNRMAYTTDMMPNKEYHKQAR
ncbi:MAG: peroxidase-related enzyme [Rhodospirillaceae bacterium]|nr:peroxidase-related enzyme [Rhodospirillaceae bacterium]